MKPIYTATEADLRDVLPEILAEALTDDGDTVEHDGRTYRLRVEPDFDTRVNDFDCYGRTEHYSHDYRYRRDTQRPADMDGNAEKLDFHDGWIWWQPPTRECGLQRDEPGFDKMREQVLDIVRWGFQVLILEQLDPDPDAYGRPVVRHVASVGGVEPFTSGEYLAGIVADLAWEIQHEAVSA